MLRDATEIGDVMMFNEYYSTWYQKSCEVVSSELDRIHGEYPNKSLVISEWGFFETLWKGGDARRVKEMIQQKKDFDSKPYVSGAIYFCFNDYRSHYGEDYKMSYPRRIHGVVDIFLKHKPSYDTLKNISAPLQIIKIKKQGDKILVTLRGNTGLPSYIVRNYTLSVGDKTLVIADLKPGEEKTIEVKSINLPFKIIIKRPTGYMVQEMTINDL